MARPLRYTFILVLAALATTLAAVGGWRYARASAPVNGPLVLISIDTLRADHLPAYGYRSIKTPAIDELAADGVLFERAYSHAAQTLPAHVSILSGKLPFETGVRDEGVAIKGTERLLPQLLHDRGYRTGGFVSSGLLGRDTGIARGFDLFDADFVPSRRIGLPFSRDIWADANTLRRDGADSEAAAERWLDSAATSRIFLFLHLDEPRAPYADHFESGSATYDSEIVYADDIVGRLVRYLKTHQLYDRSTIVLSSDHGEGLGDHGESEHGLFVYDESIHVPLIIKQAAGVAAGRRVADLVQHIDIVPTILELVKAPVPGYLGGRSLRPLIEGNGHLSEPTVYSEALYGQRHFGWSPVVAITGARYKYVTFMRVPHEELFDLSRDPHERENIVAGHAKERQALNAVLSRILAGAGKTAEIAPGGDAAASEPDPKETYEIVETYRAAAHLAGSRKWSAAIRLLQAITRQNDHLPEVWERLAATAMRIERFDLAADAYARGCELEPVKTSTCLGAAAALLKLRRFEEARARAEAAAELSGDRSDRLAAHELLARIALGRHDADRAREEADLARQVDPSTPLPAFVEGRLLYDEGTYGEALPHFEEALRAVKRPRSTPFADLHFLAADTFARLDRPDEAEPEYVEELRDFPDDARASAALAALYQTTGRLDEAGRVIEDMLQTTPTPEAYATAARLWTTFGNARQAAATRNEARRVFGDER